MNHCTIPEAAAIVAAVADTAASFEPCLDGRRQILFSADAPVGGNHGNDSSDTAFPWSVCLAVVVVVVAVLMTSVRHSVRSIDSISMQLQRCWRCGSYSGSEAAAAVLSPTVPRSGTASVIGCGEHAARDRCVFQTTTRRGWHRTHAQRGGWSADL